MKPWIAGIAALVCSGLGAVASLFAYVCQPHIVAPLVRGANGSLFHDHYFVSCAGNKIMAVLSFGASLLLLALAIRSAPRSTRDTGSRSK